MLLSEPGSSEHAPTAEYFRSVSEKFVPMNPVVCTNVGDTGASWVRWLAASSTDTQADFLAYRITAPPPAWLAPALKGLARSVDSPWTVGGALISDPTARVAQSLLSEIARLSVREPNVLPGVGGSVLVTWTTPGIDVEIRVDRAGQVTFSASDEPAGIDDDEAPLTNERLRWLAETLPA